MEDTRHIVESTSNKAAGRNFLKGKLSRFANSNKIAYLASKEDTPSDTRAADIDRMLDDFQDSEEIAFTSIADVPISDFEEVA